jgi:hypothetical protein
MAIDKTQCFTCEKEKKAHIVLEDVTKIFVFLI